MISTESNRTSRDRVLRSINNDEASRCVDVFLRPEGTIGFEEYRRDAEDGRGWFPIGAYSSRVFADEGAALCAATEAVTWLREMLGG